MSSQKRFYRPRDLVGTTKTRKRGDFGMLGFSPALLWRKVKKETFTPPVKLSEGITAFPADQADEVIAAMAAGASEDELRKIVRRQVAARMNPPKEPVQREAAIAAARAANKIRRASNKAKRESNKSAASAA